MEKVVKYVAFDGAEFDYEDDCLDYELETRAKEYLEYFALYDCDRKPIKFCADDQVLDRTCYIIVKAEKAVSFLDDWMIDYGRCRTIGKSADRENIENRVGLWMWDEKEEIWKHWETEIAKMRELGEYFQRFEE
jgi:hypothetical protein